jgi:hypothetical protein
MATLNRTPQRPVNRSPAPAARTAGPKTPTRTDRAPARRDDVLARYAQTAVDDDTLHRRATQSSGQYDSFLVSDIKFYRAQVGDNAVRILPRSYEVDEAAEKYPHLHEAGKIDGHFSFTIYVHGNIGADNGQYLCREKMLGEHCSICDEYRRLKAEGMVDEAREINPSQRHMMWVIDRSDMNTGPKVWVVSTKIDKEIASRCRSKRTGNAIDLTNPFHGYDVLFVREGQKLNTQYLGWDIDREESPLADDDEVAREWLEFIEQNKLIDILNFHEDEYVAGVMAGAPTAAPAEEEEEQQPARSPRRGGNGSARSLREQVEEPQEEVQEEVEEEQQDGEQQEEVQEEVEEEVPPRRAPARQESTTRPVQRGPSKPAGRTVQQAQADARGSLSRLQQNRRR